MWKKLGGAATLGALVTLALAPLAFAQAGETLEAARVNAFIWRMITASFALALAAVGGAIGQSRSIASALEGTARNPGAAGELRVSMIIGLALIESLVIYTFIVCLIIITTNPLG